MLASMPGVSRLVGTTIISSVLWMGLFRCDCPDVGMIKLPNIFILWYTGDNGSFVLKRPDLPLQHAIMGRMRLCRTLFLFPTTVILFVETDPTAPTAAHKRNADKKAGIAGEIGGNRLFRHATGQARRVPYSLTSSRKEVTTYNTGRTLPTSQIFPTATGFIGFFRKLRSFC